MAQNISKSELVQQIIAYLQVIPPTTPKKAVEETLKALASIVETALKEGKSITIPGIVKLRTVNKPASEARDGINPFTKEKMKIPAKPAMTKIKAIPAKVLKNSII